MLAASGLAAVAGLTGCTKKSPKLNLLFHGLMIHEVQTDGFVYVHMPLVPQSEGDPHGTSMHIYCATQPGKRGKNDWINFDPPAQLGGKYKPSQYELVGTRPALESQELDPGFHTVLRRQHGGDFNFGSDSCQDRLQVTLKVPWPDSILRYRVATAPFCDPAFGGDLATTYYVLNKSFPMVYVFEYFDAVNAQIQTAGGRCIWSAAGKGIDAVNIHAEPPIATCDNHFPCLVKALAWDPTQFKMNYPAGMSQAAVVQGTAASLGVDDADMYGVQGAPSTCSAVAPKSTPPGCLTMTSSDPGSCAQVIVTG
jgi:hypothetical protein